MYEYYITHLHCGMNKVIYGYSFSDACRRAKIDPSVWELTDWEYVD